MQFTKSVGKGVIKFMRRTQSSLRGRTQKTFGGSPSLPEDRAFRLASDFLELFKERCAEALSRTNWAPGGEELEPFQERDISNLSRYLHHVPALVEASFWASLERIEGRNHRLSVVFTPQDLNSNSYMFKKPIQLESRHLALLAPAVQGSASIGVWP